MFPRSATILMLLIVEIIECDEIFAKKKCSDFSAFYEVQADDDKFGPDT
jgi:hypothetical protein